MEQVATIEDFRRYGELFGQQLAAEATRNAAAGMSKERNGEIVLGVCRMRESHLRGVGASSDEIAAYLRAAGHAAGTAHGYDLLGFDATTTVRHRQDG